MSVTTYSPKNMTISISGNPVTGFSDSDMVTVSLDEPKFVKYVSVDGPVARSHNVSDTGRFVFSLSQTSELNKILDRVLALDVDRADGKGTEIFAVFLLDPSTGKTYMANNCWIEGMPEQNYAKEIQSLEWVIEAEDIDYSKYEAAKKALGAVSGLT